ncbi:hypothetical protein GA0061105_10776 [Rhizobium aethiopicum]|uniref:Uncharacterized protein n=1 Tax=Rhizobium aethiopicum TaxID=1138170 RepID=A0A1C3Y4P5_9HYPH|nr:hypothetical protein GA0061105_10776 [Rhizobium aethiopicum]
MGKRTLILLTAGAERFNYRIAGLGFRDGHVLVHRAVHVPFWTFWAAGRRSAKPRRRRCNGR